MSASAVRYPKPPAATLIKPGAVLAQQLSPSHLPTHPSYQPGVGFAVYSLPAGSIGLPATFPPAASPLASGGLPTPFCSRLADCFTDGSRRAFTQNVASLVR